MDIHKHVVSFNYRFIERGWIYNIDRRVLSIQSSQGNGGFHYKYTILFFKIPILSIICFWRAFIAYH